MMTIMRKLPVRITDDEKIRYGELSAHETQQLEAEQEAKTAANSAFKARIDRHANEVSRLSHIIASGEEYREVECEKKLDFSSGKVQVIRKDTGELIEERPMTPEEEQRSLDLM